MRSIDQMPPRISTLKQEFFESKTQTCYERALAITRSYKASEDEPMVIRRGKA